MHQVAQRYVNRISNQHSTERKISIVLLLANTLDCETLSAALGQHQNLEVLAATSDLDFGIARCQRLCPQVLILDPKICADAMQQVTTFVRSREVAHLLVLDDRLHEGRLSSLLDLPSVSYITRQAGLEPLIAGLMQIGHDGARTFDPSVQQRVQHNTNGLRLDQSANPRSLSLLTTRELEVMTLLASGNSVRSCAERLNLAESTIDNHKSRLMKKLDIHKIVELTHVAIREGLIVV